MSDFPDKLSRGMEGDGCKSSEFDCIPQPELNYFYALFHVPVSDVMNFKREIMNKHISPFITYICAGLKFVITCCSEADENASLS